MHFFVKSPKTFNSDSMNAFFVKSPKTCQTHQQY